MLKSKVLWLIVGIVIVSIAIWFWIGSPTEQVGEKTYVKSVRLSAESVSKLPASLNPLTYRLMFGRDLMVERGEVVQNPAGAPVSVVVFNVADGVTALIGEYKAYFANTGWKTTGETSGAGQTSLFVERGSERVAVVLAPKDGRTWVKLSYQPPL